MGKLKVTLVLYILFWFANPIQAQEIDSVFEKEYEELMNEPSVGPSMENVAEINQLLNEARKHLSTPYRAGGKDPRGFDCSGFVGHCFWNTLGIKTPASSSEFNKYGMAVSVDDCRPGDVICFKGSRRNKRIGHVGIVTEVNNGNVFFIHSANRGGIRSDQLNDPYYKSRFSRIRRIIP